MTERANTTASTEPSDPASTATDLKYRRRTHQSSFSERGPNRRSSLLSQHSYQTNSSSFEPRPFSVRSSTEDLFSPQASRNAQEIDHETSIWHSLPLLFAIFPAIGGLLFNKGSVLITDLALLVFAAIYLNWCLVTPWTWYRTSQSRVAETHISEEAVEEPLDLDGKLEEQEEDGNEAGGSSSKNKNSVSGTSKTSKAAGELRVHEIFALTLCFIGPLLGSYILHVIRHSLSRVSDDLVSEMHLTLFVLCAEIRPMRHAIKLTQARTLFLQRVIRENPGASDEPINQEDLKALRGAVLELEASFSELSAEQAASAQTKEKLKKPSSQEDTEVIKRLQNQQGQLQTQTDALTRAVRRYEKRATAQSMQTEARLQDLELRLRETLTLAAAAAKVSNNSGVFAGFVNSITETLLLPVKVARAMVAYPLSVMDKVLTEVMVLFGLSSRSSATSSSKKSASANGSATAYGYRKNDMY